MKSCAPAPLDAFTENLDHGGHVDKSRGAGGCNIVELNNKIIKQTSTTTNIQFIIQHNN